MESFLRLRCVRPDAHRADGHSPIFLAASGATDYWYRETRGCSHSAPRDTVGSGRFFLGLGAGYTAYMVAAMGDQKRLEVPRDGHASGFGSA